VSAALLEGATSHVAFTALKSSCEQQVLLAYVSAQTWSIKHLCAQNAPELIGDFQADGLPFVKIGELNARSLTIQPVDRTVFGAHVCNPVSTQNFEHHALHGEKRVPLQWVDCFFRAF